MRFLLTPRISSGYNCSVVSLNGKMYISFSKTGIRYRHWNLTFRPDKSLMERERSDGMGKTTARQFLNQTLTKPMV